MYSKRAKKTVPMRFQRTEVIVDGIPSLKQLRDSCVRHHDAWAVLVPMLKQPWSQCLSRSEMRSANFDSIWKLHLLECELRIWICLNLTCWNDWKLHLLECAQHIEDNIIQYQSEWIWNLCWLWKQGISRTVFFPNKWQWSREFDSS